MFNAYRVDDSDGMKSYRVECQGIFASEQTCMKKATRMCGDKPVQVIQIVRPFQTAPDPRPDPRVMTFRCEAPVAAATTPPPRIAPIPMPAPPRTLQLEGDADFAVDGSTLNETAVAKLDELLQQAGDASFKTVRITGYTDSTASLQHNMALSQARAKSVMQYLKSQGLRADDYIVRGAGPAEPVASNATASGRAQNRRVEIRLSTD
jgi:outer membrane protein OmpA-like peptidoglycan-associated protein